jgi:hypothetical protein
MSTYNFNLIYPVVFFSISIIIYLFIYYNNIIGEALPFTIYITQNLLDPEKNSFLIILPVEFSQSWSVMI